MALNLWLTITYLLLKKAIKTVGVVFNCLLIANINNAEQLKSLQNSRWHKKL